MKCVLCSEICFLSAFFFSCRGYRELNMTWKDHESVSKHLYGTDHSQGIIMDLWRKTKKNHGKLQPGESINQSRFKTDTSHINLQLYQQTHQVWCSCSFNHENLFLSVNDNVRLNSEDFLKESVYVQYKINYALFYLNITCHIIWIGLHATIPPSDWMYNQRWGEFGGTYSPRKKRRRAYNWPFTSS